MSIGGNGAHLPGHVEKTLLAFPGPHPAGHADQLGIQGDIESMPKLAASIGRWVELPDLDAIEHHLQLA